MSPAENLLGYLFRRLQPYLSEAALYLLLSVNGSAGISSCAPFIPLLPTLHPMLSPATPLEVTLASSCLLSVTVPLEAALRIAPLRVTTPRASAHPEQWHLEQHYPGHQHPGQQHHYLQHHHSSGLCAVSPLLVGSHFSVHSAIFLLPFILISTF